MSMTPALWKKGSPLVMLPCPSMFCNSHGRPDQALGPYRCTARVHITSILIHDAVYLRDPSASGCEQ
jgi:hypothetical protein